MTKNDLNVTLLVWNVSVMKKFIKRKDFTNIKGMCWLQNEDKLSNMYENNIYNMKISDSNLISPDKSQKNDMYEINITWPTTYKSYEAISDDRDGGQCSD